MPDYSSTDEGSSVPASPVETKSSSSSANKRSVKKQPIIDLTPKKKTVKTRTNRGDRKSYSAVEPKTSTRTLNLYGDRAPPMIPGSISSVEAIPEPKKSINGIPWFAHLADKLNTAIEDKLNQANTEEEFQTALKSLGSEFIGGSDALHNYLLGRARAIWDEKMSGIFVPIFPVSSSAWGGVMYDREHVFTIKKDGKHSVYFCVPQTMIDEVVRLNPKQLSNNFHGLSAQPVLFDSFRKILVEEVLADNINPDTLFDPLWIRFGKAFASEMVFLLANFKYKQRQRLLEPGDLLEEVFPSALMNASISTENGRNGPSNWFNASEKLLTGQK